MKTKLVSLFVALFASTALWAYGFKSGDLYYYILNNDEVEVTHSSDNYAGLTSITIPSSVTHDGTTYRVTSIGFDAFYGCTGLTSITISNSVTSIALGAFFGCAGLTSIIVEDGNKVYDSRSNCNAIIETSTNTLIQGCKTTIIPNSVTSIEHCAFSDCTGLTSITIPNSVTSIGQAAFSGCTGLTSITIPNSVTSIEYCAFSSCTGLTSITIPNSVTSIGKSAFRDCTGLTSITIPNSVTSIGSGAFSGCTGLTSITIPNSVTSIEYGAFSGCTGLTSITIPNSVTSIGDWAFGGCTGLTSITIPNSVTSIGEAAFEGCTGLTSITIPNSVTSIGDWAFSDCTGLTSVTIPNSVTSIGKSAFRGCTGLTSITIPNSVTSIGESAFFYCTGLTSITIPNSVTSIGYRAFDGCTGLTSVLIGNNSELSMDDATFFGDANLTQVTCYANVPPHIGYFGYDKDSLTEKTLYVPVSAIDKYKEADIWKDFGHIVPISATPTDTDEPVIMPSYTEVTIAWPTTIGAKTYTITITKDTKTICSLTFDNTGVLINAAFAAPSYNGNAHQAPAAQYTQSAFWFTFSGLECNTQYDYSIVAQSSNGQPINTYNGTFRTTAPTAIDNVSSSSSNNAAVQTRKVFRNGQVLIQHNSKTYTISGNEVK